MTSESSSGERDSERPQSEEVAPREMALRATAEGEESGFGARAPAVEEEADGMGQGVTTGPPRETSLMMMTVFSGAATPVALAVAYW